MAITTYAELKTAMADWSHRSDLTTYLDDFIDQTESFFRLSPVSPSEPGIGGIRANITRATGTLSAGTETLARPSDFLEAYRFRLTADTGGLVEYTGPENIGLYKRTGSGMPHYWTVSDVIEFDVAPDSAYAYELSYYPDFVALDGTNTTNWVITNHPNIYLSGCLYNLYSFIQDAENRAHWLTQFKSTVHGVNDAYRRSRYSQGPIAARLG